MTAPITASSTMLRSHLSPRRHPKVWLLAGLLLAAVALQGGPANVNLDGAQRTATPFPSLLYRIEATSNGHTASLLNLPIGQPGVLQAPMPVDVDGDLLFDVTVAVNLVDTQGLHNPPRVGDIIRPNIEINRFPLELGTTLLGRPSPPVRINVAFDIHDLEGEEDTMTARFGYDTGPAGSGGSIPPYFQATVEGLENFFNPVTARISTKGDLITQSSAPLWYRGPLTIIGGFEQGDFDAKLDLRYTPFPDQVTVTYASDDEGDHIDYAHAFDGEVDLHTKAVIEDEGERIDVGASVFRLPRALGFDMLEGTEGAGIHFDTTADGRLPDVDVRFKGPLLGDVFDAHLSVEDLPTAMDASWSLPDGGPVHASFTSSGQGIGAIEAEIKNKNGSPTGLPPFLFGEQQVAAAQLNSATGGIRVGARLERVRSARIDASPDGEVDAEINVGDGELPLELSGFLDLRGDDGPLIDATSTVSPLPGHLGASLRPAGKDQLAKPLKLVYEASEAVDVDTDVLVRLPKATSSACGEDLVLCGNLRLRHIPERIEARVGSFTNAEGKQETRIEADTEGPGHVDLFADVKVGADVVAVGPLSGKPLVANLEMLGITKHARVRTIEGQDDTLQRAEFHTCPYDFAADACPAGTQDDRIGALQFGVANFLPQLRPADLAPAYAATPNFATVTVRGREQGQTVDFEATGRMTDIREFTYVNQGTFGWRTRIGGNQDLAALVDVDDIAFGAGGPGAKLFDVTGDVLISPLPETMAFCLNAPGRAVVAPVSSLTAPCQDKNPFATAVDRPALAKSPLSVAYDGSDGNGNPQEFDVEAKGELLAHNGAGVDDDRRIRGELDLDHIPAKIHAHLLDPKDVGGGPLKLLVDAPTLGDQLRVSAKAAMLDGDLQCEDPRVPKALAGGASQSAVCAQGVVENVPNRLTLDYDAEATSDNFVLDSTGEKRLNLTGLKVSSVTRDASTGRAQVLIAEGEVLDLPRKVEGTLVTPAPDQEDDPILVDLTATPELGGINASVRNFIAPDPIPDMPAQRAGLPQPPADQLLDHTDNFDWASFIQRGDAFRGEIHISKVKRVGFKNQATASGQRLDTSVVNVDFGATKTVRGYVDIDQDGTERLIGDVTLTDVPAGLQVCFRGATALTGAAANPTFCDTNPGTAAERAKQGAFEARMTGAGDGLDVDAFVRAARGGGGDVLAARVDIDNIPKIVRGTFGDGKADVAGFRFGTAGEPPVVPDGIDRIYANAASFDLPDDLSRSDDGDGWTPATRPYAPRFVTRSPFPTPFPASQHVAVRADDADFEVRARLGAVEPSAEPASDLHRIRLSDTPCAKPTGVDYGSGAPDYGPRPDFPHLPDDGTGYTCIRGDFEPVGTSTVDPLALSLIVDKGGKRMAVENGLLDDIPEFFQVNVADADPLQNQDDKRMRPHCIGAGRTQPANCVAPLVRLDTPGNSRLSGVVKYGALADLARLATVSPREALPDDLTDSGALAFASDDVRARVGSFGSSTAATAAFRIPIPASFTIDQVQSWSMQNVSNKENYLDASDLHFRYAARNANGSSIGVLLKLSAMIHSFTDGSQVLLSDDDPSQGVQIPGELGVELYGRNHNGKGRNFIQIDGRSSAPDLDLRARILGTGGSAIGRLDAQVRDVPAMASTSYPAASAAQSAYTDPSFRIRAEILGEGKEPPDPSGADEASAGEPPKEEECSPLLCILTQVRLKSVNVQFDFQPGDAPAPARLLEAVVRTDGAKNGVEIRGFSVIDHDSDDDGMPDAAAAPFLAGAQLEVDPLNLFIHAGIPFLASLDFVLESSLDAAASIGGNFKTGTFWEEGQYDPGGLVPQLEGPGSERFFLKQNLLKMTMRNEGPDGSFSQLGPIDFNVDVMHGEAWALFVKLIGIDWVPPGDSLRLPFLECSALGLVGSSVVQVPEPLFDGDGDGERSVVAWPFFSPPTGNVVYSGLLGGPLTLIGNLAGPFFCLVDTDQALIDYGDEEPHPADPLGTAVTASAVPDARIDASELVTAAEDTGPDELPDLTVSATTPALCGTKTYNHVTIPAGVTLNVATAANATKLEGLDACPAGAEGTLELILTGNITVDGVLQASNLVTSTNASGNGGGGHGIVGVFGDLFEEGRGGAGGTSGSGGPPTGDRFDPFVIETGNAGSAVANGGAAGQGGGSVKIVADTLTVGPSGAIRADGEAGTPKGGAPADCFDADTDGDGPDTGKANTGFGGGGGGSGGGIVVHTAEYVVSGGGAISANGGSGGAGTRGGGGGGGGGNIKIDTALRSGAAPTANGGAGGADLCGNTADDPGTTGGAGDGWAPGIKISPKSKVDVSEFEPEELKDFGFWHTTAGTESLVLPYQAAAEVSGTSDDFDVALCATSRVTSLNLPTDKPLSQVLMPAQPGSVSLTNPCGSFGVGTILDNPGLGQPQRLMTHEIDNDRRTSDASFTVDTLSESYYGFYTMVWKSSANGNHCFDRNDLTPDVVDDLFDDLAEFQHDAATCSAEAAPTSPDLALGVDNDAPNIQNFTVNGVGVRDGTGALVPNVQPVPSGTDDILLTWTDSDNRSGVVGRECTGGHGTIGLRNCVSGQTVTVSSGDGTKTVAVKLIDAAGNEDTFTATVLLDRTVPTSTGQVLTGTATQLQNGWFLSSPRFRLDGFNDGTGTGPATTPWEYQFDEGDVRPCADLVCVIGDSAGEDLPGIGRHALRWTPVDKVGNKLVVTQDNPKTIAVNEYNDPRPVLTAKIDGARPLSDLLSVPAAPNGANGWYSGPTWVTFGAFDQPGASGFVKASDDATDIGGVYYTKAYNGGAPSAPVRFNVAAPTPVRLDPGTTVICWQAKDQAGNVDAALGSQCRTFRVDETDPTTTLPTTPDTPNGGAGWYTSTPVVDPTVTDGGLLGSGVGTHSAGVCRQNPVIADPAPTGTCLSVDGGPFLPVEHPGQKYQLTLGEGLHEVRAFATDAAGRRSAIATRLYQVDLSNPTAVARTIMPRPSAGKWWRHVPTVVLRAADGDRHGSGVARVRYQFSGTSAVAPCTAAACTYTGPFTVPQGVYRVTYWAEDSAGRAQRPQVLKVAVDTTAPVPKATTPNPSLWLRSKTGLPLTSPTVDLRWTLQENLSGVTSPDNDPKDKVNVKVVVYDLMGYPVRTLNAGDYLVTPGQTLSGKAVWDGKGANLTSLLPLGTYYYRVVATDAAGNVAMSGESAKLVIALSLL